MLSRGLTVKRGKAQGLPCPMKVHGMQLEEPEVADLVRLILFWALCTDVGSFNDTQRSDAAKPPEVVGQYGVEMMMEISQRVCSVQSVWEVSCSA